MGAEWLALIGILFGGVAVKIAEKLLGRGQAKTDEATEMRNELRADLARYREELKEEAKDADKWREKFYELKTELMIQNYKSNRVAEVVNAQHPESHLIEDFEGIENPGK